MSDTVDCQSFNAMLHAVPVFLGVTSEDPIRWILKIERVALPLQCNDDAKLAVAMSKLEGSAYDWSESCTFATWGDFKAAFFQRYCEDVKVIKQRLSRCRQAAGECVMSYVDRFRVLAMRARLTDLEEVMEKFLGGLLPTIYDRTIVACPVTFEQAIEKAVYFEKKVMMSKVRMAQSEGPEDPNHVHVTRHVNHNPNNFGQPRYGPSNRPEPRPWNNSWKRGPATNPTPAPIEPSSVSELRQGFGKMQLNTRMARPSDRTPICYLCQEPGHISTYCPNKRYTKPLSQHPQQVMTRCTHQTDGQEKECQQIRQGRVSCSPFEEWSSGMEDFESDEPDLPNVAPIQASQPGVWFRDENGVTNQAGSGRDTGSPPDVITIDEDDSPGKWGTVHSIGMRRGAASAPQHTILERMDVDRPMQPIPRPHVRRAFPTNIPPRAGNSDNEGLPPGGPRVIRRPPIDRREGVAATPMLCRNEVRALEEMFSGIKLRSLGIGDMCNVRINTVLQALADKILEYVHDSNSQNPPGQRGGSRMEHINVTEIIHSKPTVKPVLAHDSPGTESYYDVLQARMHVHDALVDVIVDTGATSSAIGFEFVLKLGLMEAIEDTEITYVNADGLHCEAMGILRKVPVRVGGLCLSVDALVIKGTHYDFLVGIDFLSPARATINFVDRTLEFSIDKNLRGRTSVTCTNEKPRAYNRMHMFKTYGVYAAIDPSMDQGIGRPWAPADTTTYPPVTGAVMHSPFEGYTAMMAADDDIWPAASQAQSSQLNRADSLRLGETSCPSQLTADLPPPGFPPLGGAVMEPPTSMRSLGSDYMFRSYPSPPLHYVSTKHIPMAKVYTRYSSPSVAEGPCFMLGDNKVSINSNIDMDGQNSVWEVIMGYEDVFSMDKIDIGCTHSVMHTIDVGDARPVKQLPYRLSHAEREIVQEEVRKMLEADVIEPCSGPWASPVVLVPKKQQEHGVQTYRFAINYIKLNQVTRLDSFPTPSIGAIIDDLAEGRYFTTLDLRSSYWQVLVHPDSRDYTAFVTTHGMYRFKRMPFGLCNAGATMQRLMNTILQPLIWDCVQVFIDDIVIYSPSVQQHVRDLTRVFEILREAGLKVALEKSVFARDEIIFLGNKISGPDHTVAPDPAKVESVKHYPVPSTVKQIRAFLGLASFYRRFIASFAAIAEPLTRLLRKNQPFIWGDEQQEAFDELKDRLTAKPVLRLPRFNDKNLKWILYTDWSTIAIGAILAQRDMITKEEYVVSYASRRINTHEANYSPTEGEALAVVHWVGYFRPYLYDQEFIVYSDNSALSFLNNVKDLHGRLGRWALKLSIYKFKIEYRSGSKQSHVDALTRQYPECPAPAVKRINVLRLLPPLAIQRPMDSILEEEEEDNQAKNAAAATCLATTTVACPPLPHSTPVPVPEPSFGEHSKGMTEEQQLPDFSFLHPFNTDRMARSGEYTDFGKFREKLPTLSQYGQMLSFSPDSGRVAYSSALSRSQCSDDVQKHLSLGEPIPGNPRMQLVVRNLLNFTPKLINFRDAGASLHYLRQLAQKVTCDIDLAATIVSIKFMAQDNDSSHAKLSFTTPQAAQHFFRLAGPQLMLQPAARFGWASPSVLPYLTMEEQAAVKRLTPHYKWFEAHFPEFLPVWYFGKILLSVKGTNPLEVVVLTAYDLDEPLLLPAHPSPFTVPPPIGPYLTPTIMELLTELLSGFASNGDTVEGEHCILAVEGGIGSGKSTCLQLAAAELKLAGFTTHLEPIMTHAPEIVTKFYGNPVLYAMDLQAAVLASYAKITPTSSFIVERSPMASLQVFAQQLCSNGILTVAQYKQLKDFGDKIICWQPTAYIYVNTPLDICMQRIAIRARKGERAIHPQLLLDHAYYYSCMLGEVDKPVHFVDGTAAPSRVASELLAIAEQYSPHINVRNKPCHAANPPLVCTRHSQKRERESSPSTERPGKKVRDGIPQEYMQAAQTVPMTGRIAHANVVKSTHLQFSSTSTSISSTSSPSSMPDTDDTIGISDFPRVLPHADEATPKNLVTILDDTKAIDNVACRVCDRRDQEGTLLLCDNCNAGYHTGCLKRPLSSVPSGAWVCEECAPGFKDAVVDIVDDADVLEYIRTGRLPVTPGVTATEKRRLTKRIQKRARGYLVLNGLLFRKASKSYPRNRRVPAVAERHGIITQCHDGHGHFGVAKTAYLVARNYFWPGMNADVKQYVAACHSCQCCKTGFKLKTTLHPLPVVGLFSRWSVDLCGPLIPSRAAQNTYLMVCVDSFSRWVEAEALPNKFSATVASFFQKGIIFRYGAPLEVMTDNGTEWSLQFTELLNKHGIIHKKSAPYSPSQNGLAERYVGVIVNAIKRSLKAHNDSWDEHISQVVTGHNLSIQASTKYCPYFLVYGKEPRFGDPADIHASTLALESEVAHRSQQLQQVTELAITNVKRAQEKQCIDYDRRRPMDTKPLMEINTLVLIKAHKKSKLGLPSEGPYILRKYNKKATLALVEDKEGRQWTENVTYVEPYTPADRQQRIES